MTGVLWVALPLVCLAGGAFVSYVTGRLLMARLPGACNKLLASLTAVTFLLALGALAPLYPMTQAALSAGRSMPQWGSLGAEGAYLRADPGGVLVVSIALGMGALVTVYSGRYLALDRRYETYYPLLLLLVTGLAGMVLAADLFNLYMFCELMSISAYALVAFRRQTGTAIEAGFKYLVMGSVGTVIILMGISFIYRETGDLSLPEGVRWGQGDLRGAVGPWARVGLACTLVGLGVKSAIVPAHTWLPDAHGRAPSSISAMLSGIVIQSAFYALLKVSLGSGLPARSLGTVLIVLSLLNMTLGNGLALIQTNTKRLLAYSTIAQMGYIMLSVGIGLRYGILSALQAGFFLILAHAAMKGLAFLSKGVCRFYCDTTAIAQLKGIVSRLPLAAVTFAVALGGLAGMPPLAGFAGKWFLMTQVLGAADALLYVGLVVFLLNGVLSLGYYLPLIGTLFSSPPAPLACGEENEERVRISAWMVCPLVILGGLVLAIGLYPGPWLDWTAGAGIYLQSLAR
ncbi:MAG: hypothetical protein ISS56_15125 [Anaerolineae bacterium]|nr:hypothetical protein [Anaerolineae bacterium]